MASFFGQPTSDDPNLQTMDQAPSLYDWVLQASDDEVLDKIGDALKAMLFQEVDVDMEPERYLQIANALRNALYWQAKQYLRVGTRPDESLGWLPLGMPSGSDMGNNSYAAFRYVINIIRADGTKFTAVLGQRAPHVEAVSNDTEDDASNQKADDANAVIRYLKDDWDADHLQKDVARHLFRTGPCFGYTFYNADPSLYGWREVPTQSLEDQPISGYRCPNCQTLNDEDQALGSGTCAECGSPIGESNFEQTTVQVPAEGPPERIPRGKVELRLYRIFEAIWPPAATSVKECGWFNLEWDEHQAKLLSCYVPNRKSEDPAEQKRIEKITKLIRSDSVAEITGSKQLAADAQEILLSQTVLRNQRRNMARLSLYWIRPEWFELLRKASLEDDIIDALWEKYPTGLKTTMIRGTPIKIKGESMDEVISVFKPGTDEKILSDAWCQDEMPVQDNINHFANMTMESFLRMIPKVLYPADLFDRRSIEENDPTVSEFIPYNPRAYAGNISNMVVKTPTGDVSAQIMPFGEYLREFGREATGTPEQIWGGGTPSQTFRSDLLRRNQALMTLGIPDDEMKKGWEATYFNGVRQLAKYSGDVIKIPAQYLQNGQEMGDLQALADGTGWHCEADEGLPLSHAEEREQLLDFVNTNPILTQKLELLSDLNTGNLLRYTGIRGFKSRKEMESKKFRQILKQLLMTGPLPGQPDPMTGQPGPPQPSVPIDQFEDDHEFMAQAARDFLNDGPGLRLKQSNPQAYQNVLAFGMAHQRAEMMEPKPAPATAPPPKRGAPGPPSAPGAGGAPGGAPLTAATKPQGGAPPAATAAPPPQATIGAPALP